MAVLAVYSSETAHWSTRPAHGDVRINNPVRAPLSPTKGHGNPPNCGLQRRCLTRHNDEASSHRWDLSTWPPVWRPRCRGLPPPPANRATTGFFRCPRSRRSRPVPPCAAVMVVKMVVNGRRSPAHRDCGGRADGAGRGVASTQALSVAGQPGGGSLSGLPVGSTPHAVRSPPRSLTPR